MGPWFRVAATAAVIVIGQVATAVAQAMMEQHLNNLRPRPQNENERRQS